LTDPTVRSAVSADIPALIAVAQGTAMFTPDEMAFMEGSVRSHFDEPQEGHRWTVLEAIGGGASAPSSREAGAATEARVLGAANLAPEMADGVFNLLFIGTLPDHRRLGGGSLLLRDAEAHLRGLGARLMIVDTSSLPAFGPARAFYARHGYDEEARIRDYWKPGDDKVTFRKQF
jgi:ribosomal protein S18 acetylase RimI-like enzyme